MTDQRIPVAESARDAQSRNDRRRYEMVEGFRSTINRSSGESASDTPDYILAEYLMVCLEAFNKATEARTRHYHRG